MSNKEVCKDRLPVLIEREKGVDRSRSKPAIYPCTLPYLLDVDDLTITAGSQTLVEKVSFSMKKGEILSLVGESGSGKTITARAIMQLFSSPALSISQGTISWKGRPLLGLSDAELENFRGSEIGYIPQSPMSALNPMMTIGSQLRESYKKGSDALRVAHTLLAHCGFQAPEAIMKAYPEELSGGGRQRVVIAMALMNTPDLIIADEPTTALDVSIQAEVLDLLMHLVRTEGISLLFITHDLGIVARISDRVMVMRNGTIVEEQEVYALFEHPQNPYTKQLIAASS